jgi:hypothetical protein
MGKTDIGQGKQALCLAGGGVVGYSNSSGAVTYATSSPWTVTPTTSPSWTASSTSNYGSTNVWMGYIVVAGGGSSTTPLVMGVCTSNTATALTVDYWRNPATPTTQASAPAANSPFIIVNGNASCWWMAISTATTTAATDTALASELTTNGLARAAATFAHTFSSTSVNNTYTLTNTFTYTGSSATTIDSIGIFDASSNGIPLFTTVLNSSATVSANGDQVTITETVTM